MAESHPYRVVLDTNVVLSALLFNRGHLVFIREAWWHRIFVPLVSRRTTSELMQVLAYPKFHLTADEVEELLADYLPYGEIVRTAAFQADLPSCRDPLDVPFLTLAMVGHADYLVSGDNDLQALKEEMGPCRILQPKEFIRILEPPQKKS